MKIILKSIFLLLVSASLIFAAARPAPRSYYVVKGAAAGGDGLTYATAFDSLADINRLTTTTIFPADTVKLYGYFYGEQLTLPVTAKVDSLINCIGYNGATINASELISTVALRRGGATGTWGNVSGNVYAMNMGDITGLAASDTAVNVLWFPTIEKGVRKLTRASFTTSPVNGWWIYETDTNKPDSLYAYVTSISELTNVMLSNKWCVYGNFKGFWDFYNIRFVHGSGANRTGASCANINTSQSAPWRMNFYNCDFDSSGRNGIYANRGIGVYNCVFKEPLYANAYSPTTDGNTIAITAAGDSTIFINNTVYGGVYGFYASATPSKYHHMTVKNNIFYKQSLRFIVLQPDLNFSSNNVFYADDYTGDGGKWNYNEAFFESYAAWQAAGSGDVNSLVTDPLFMNHSIGDFRLQYGSPAIKAGTSAGVTTDKNGVIRYGAPDDGAYDFQNYYIFR